MDYSILASVRDTVAVPAIVFRDAEAPNSNAVKSSTNSHSSSRKRKDRPELVTSQGSKAAQKAHTRRRLFPDVPLSFVSSRARLKVDFDDAVIAPIVPTTNTGSAGPRPAVQNAPVVATIVVGDDRSVLIPVMAQSLDHPDGMHLNSGALLATPNNVTKRAYITPTRVKRRHRDASTKPLFVASPSPLPFASPLSSPSRNTPSPSSSPDAARMMQSPLRLSPPLQFHGPTLCNVQSNPVRQHRDDTMPSTHVKRHRDDTKDNDINKRECQPQRQHQELPTVNSASQSYISSKGSKERSPCVRPSFVAFPFNSREPNHSLPYLSYTSPNKVSTPVTVDNVGDLGVNVDPTVIRACDVGPIKSDKADKAVQVNIEVVPQVEPTKTPPDTSAPLSDDEMYDDLYWELYCDEDPASFLDASPAKAQALSPQIPVSQELEQVIVSIPDCSNAAGCDVVDTTAPMPLTEALVTFVSVGHVDDRVDHSSMQNKHQLLTEPTIATVTTQAACPTKTRNIPRRRYRGHQWDERVSRSRTPASPTTTTRPRRVVRVEKEKPKDGKRHWRDLGTFAHVKVLRVGLSFVVPSMPSRLRLCIYYISVLISTVASMFLNLHCVRLCCSHRVPMGENVVKTRYRCGATSARTIASARQPYCQ